MFIKAVWKLNDIFTIPIYTASDMCIVGQVSVDNTLIRQFKIIYFAYNIYFIESILKNITDLCNTFLQSENIVFNINK